MRRIHLSTWRGPVMAGVLALLVISAVFWQKQLTPFGPKNFLISDMGTQYLSFFTAYRHALLNHNWQLYSFSQSLGGNVVPTLAYYLMSPFNLILVLFSAANLPTGIAILIMVKIAAIAITMTIYLQHHYQTHRLSVAIFGVAFSLCGFVALNYFDIMWLDALIWLPLITDGIDHLLKTGHSGRFFWWLWLSIITDFYLGYMTCLFVAYYFVYMWAETKPTALKWRQDLTNRRPLLAKALLTACLSVGSSLFLLIPTTLGMLQTAKSTHAVTDFLPVPQYGLNILSQLGVGANTYADRLVHAPTIFSTTAVSLLVLAYFVHPAFTKAQKWHASSLLLALLLSMGLRLLDTIWHLFQQPEGFPFRDAFFFSFVLTTLACATWLAQPQRVTRHWQWGLPLILGSALSLGWVTNKLSGQPLTTHVLMLSLSYVLITSLVLFATKKTLRALLLTSIVTTELGANSWLSMRDTAFGSQTTYRQAYQVEDRQMTTVSDPDGQLYRVDNANTLINKAYREVYNNYNDPLLFNFHGINDYSSTLNQRTWQTLKSLGLFGKNVRRISSQGLTPVSSLILGIKADITLTRHGQAETTTSPSYLGLGFAVTNNFSQLKLTKTQALANQEAILQRLRTQPTPYFAAATILADTVTTKSQATTYHYLHRLTLKTTTSGPLYYEDLSGGTKYTTFRVNGQLIAPSVDTNGHRRLFALGNFAKGQTIHLTFKTTHRTLTKIRLASLNQAQFNQVVQHLKASAWVPEYHAKGLATNVTGTLNNRAAQPWLYVAIPYETAWQATVNGQPATTKSALNGLTLVKIGAGVQNARLHYYVPGLTVGSGLALLSLITYLGYGWYCQRHMV